MTTEFKVDEFSKAMDSYMKAVEDKIRAGMSEYANYLKETSVSDTPIDTGELRSRAYTTEVDYTDGTYECRTGYEREGAETGLVHPPYKDKFYAVYVHEMVGLAHKIGHAKFLESALKSTCAELTKMVTKRLQEIRL